MQSRRRMRYLRIAVTALSLTACVLLVALWVRSYWWSDWIDRFDKSELQTSVGSSSGTLIYSEIDWSSDPGGHVASHSWTYKVTEAFVPDENHWIDWSIRPGVFRVAISHWLLILPVALIAAAPCLHWRFSLRTLLIATTLVAVVLGMVIYLAR